MTNIKFEGAIDGISERQLEFVSSVLVKQGFNNETVLVSAIGKEDDNYMSNVKRFVVEKDGEIFKTVAKFAPTIERIRAKLPIDVLFRNEHIMYTQVFPKFAELEIAANVPEEERFKFAKCYGSQCEPPNEIILLEDLQLSSFIMFDKQIPFEDDTVKLVLKNFARLHSLSLILNNLDPETYETYKSKLTNYWANMRTAKEFIAYESQLEDDVISILDSDEHKNVVKGVLTQLPNSAMENWKTDKDSKYAAIQHGDAWANNILFKLDEDKPVECCMLDYQVANHISPALDIQFMIFISTDYESRSKHYHEWIDYYHAELDKCLTYFGLSINVIYPRDRFDDDLKRLGKLSLALSITFASFLMREFEDANKFKTAMLNENDNVEGMVHVAKFSNMTEATQSRLKTKIDGIVTSYLELGYS